MADVVVVGAGPAGTAAAITLARQGRSVVVIDKAQFPRDKICGDGLTTGALRLLEGLGLDPAGVPSWFAVQDVMVTAPSGHTVRLALPRNRGTFAAVARRADLDAAMVRLAVTAGAEVLEGHSLTSAEQRSDGVVITADGDGGRRELHAGFVIGADGMWSPLRKLLGAAEPGYLGEWHAFRQYFSHVGPAATRHLWIWFEPDLLPGYAWSFPLPDGRANVGFGVQRGTMSAHDMKRIWSELVGRPALARVLGPDARPEAPHRAWPIPARVDAVRLTAGRVLFVGDAAAATDPMTGEGIGQALLTGIRAAESIGRAGRSDPADVRRRYERAVHRELLADHRMSVTLIRALRHRRGVNAAVAVAGATPWTRRNFARWLFEDEPRAAALTPRRWHRHFLTRPGAFPTRRSDGTDQLSVPPPPDDVPMDPDDRADHPGRPSPPSAHDATGTHR